MTTKEETVTIGSLLRDKRGDRYLTEAADEIGVSRQIYPDWERGYVIPGDEWVDRLVEYLALPEDEIVLVRRRSWRVKQERENLRLRVLGLAAHVPLLQAA